MAAEEVVITVLRVAVLFVSLLVAEKSLLGSVGFRCGKVYFFIGILARYFVVAENHFSRSPQHRVVLNQVVHFLAHLTRIVSLLIDEVVHVSDLAVDHIEQSMDRRLALLGKGLRQLRKHLNGSTLVERDLMHFTLLVDEEHFAFGFFAPTKHIDVGEHIDFFFAIDVHKMSHLLLSY